MTDPTPELPTCWACGCRPRKQSNLGELGWHTRYAPYSGIGRCRECYCPLCWKAWGWPETVPDSLLARELR